LSHTLCFPPSCCDPCSRLCVVEQPQQATGMPMGQHHCRGSGEAASSPGEPVSCRGKQGCGTIPVPRWWHGALRWMRLFSGEVSWLCGFRSPSGRTGVWIQVLHIRSERCCYSSSAAAWLLSCRRLVNGV